MFTTRRWVSYVLMFYVSFSSLHRFSVVNAIPGFCSYPSPPNCPDDCEGNGYYLSEDGAQCLPCRSCDPGSILNKECGNGRNGDAVCVPCMEGTFSTGGRRPCVLCTTCLNTVEVTPCQATNDRQCGNCLSGYFRRHDRFADPNACPERCGDAPPDTPECRDWWSARDPEAQPITSPQQDEKACDPIPPKCLDDCHGNRYYYGRDGLCKMCIQCQPGYGLNKVCGNGRNGDARCRPCPKGHFSADRRGQCIPCRVCINAVETHECFATSDRECGNCLPGFYQEAENFFEPGCPNSCANNPGAPQCKDWTPSSVSDTHSKTNNGMVAENLTNREVEISQQDTQESNQDNASVVYDSMTIIIVISCLIVAVIVALATGILFLRFYAKRSALRRRDNGDTTGKLLHPSAAGSPSDTPSSSSGGSPASSAVYPNIDAPSDYLTFIGYFRQYFPNEFQQFVISRPVSAASTNESQCQDRSSVISTPSVTLNRRLMDRCYKDGDPQPHSPPMESDCKVNGSAEARDGIKPAASPPVQISGGNADVLEQASSETSVSKPSDLPPGIERPNLRRRRSSVTDFLNGQGVTRVSNVNSRNFLYVNNGNKQPQRQLNNEAEPEAALFPAADSSGIHDETDDVKKLQTYHDDGVRKMSGGSGTIPQTGFDEASEAQFNWLTPPHVRKNRSSCKTHKETPGGTTVTITGLSQPAININMTSQALGKFQVGDEHHKYYPDVNEEVTNMEHEVDEDKREHHEGDRLLQTHTII